MKGLVSGPASLRRPASFSPSSPVPPAPVPKLSYTIQQAADAIGISRSSFYEEVKDGAIATFKCKGRTLVRHETLVAYLDAIAGPVTRPSSSS